MVITEVVIKIWKKRK